MRYYFLFLILIAMGCKKEHPTVIYQSEAFSVFPDRVKQGENEAIALSPTHLRSNYRSPASETYSSMLEFKFSINEKDNEMAPGVNHRMVVGEGSISPVYIFGKPDSNNITNPGTYVPVNKEYTFRVDVSSVLSQFEEKGYYEAFDGSRVAKDDFKGFYIAGGSEPMTWDFVNLQSSGLQLKPNAENPNIYEITLVLNPYNPEDFEEKEWKLSLDLSDKPRYESDQPLVDALFNLSMEEAKMNIESDSTLRTGAKWDGVWTRDISYSIFLAFAYHEPEIAQISLMKKVKRDRIIQDTGSGGAWPVSSDRTTWALAAWEIYKVTGDKAWLEKAFTIVKNSLEDDFKVVGQTNTGMYCGESSFLDWREQTYPKWMSNMDIYVSENLGTNVVHYQAHQILGAMATELGQPADEYFQRAEKIKQGIHQFLWMEDKGYYGQYLYGRHFLNLSPRFEALGEALSILFDVASPEQARQILAKSPLLDFGTSCIYPQIAQIPPYHNNGIWPFVQAFWNLAAAKGGNEKALTHGLAAIYRAGGLFLTNYENFVAQTGDFLGTEVNSHRMLWSMAGNLAMVHRVFMGLHFEPEGIRFQPVVPGNFPGTKKLSNFRYRNAKLQITVKGTGKNMRSIKLDGQPLKDAFLPAGLEGNHEIVMELDGEPFDKEPINLVKNHFSLSTPSLSLQGSIAEWENDPDAVHYLVYINGEMVEKTTQTTFALSGEKPAQIKVSAVDSKGFESFTSEPQWYLPEGRELRIQLETLVPKANFPYVNFEGKGFVEISNQKNTTIPIPIQVDQDGDYLIDFRYSNGEGPWNTDNKCAIRSLYLDEDFAGSFVFPQRGTNEWSDWGWSNTRLFSLKKGKQLLYLQLEPWDTNMNVEVNRAMLDFIRLRRISS